MNNLQNKNTKSSKSIKGQNTAEYLVLLVLIAVGTIGVSSFFGKTLEQKMTQVTSAISGNDAGANSANAAALDTAAASIDTFQDSANGMDTERTLRYGGGEAAL